MPVSFTDAVRCALAPTGRLRASINVGNAVLARRSAGGGVEGISVDLAAELARLIDRPLETVVFEGAAKSVAALAAGDADIGFFAIDPGRSAGLRFTAPYLLIEGSYLVREDSPLRQNEEVDRAGHRVAVKLGSAYDLFLGRHLKAASLLRNSGPQEILASVLDGHAEVAAGIRQVLAAQTHSQAGLRLLPGCFMVIEQAMACPAAAGETAIAALAAFVEAMKATGFIAQAMARHGESSARVAPAA